jgi:hypothetical protein
MMMVVVMTMMMMVMVMRQILRPLGGGRGSRSLGGRDQQTEGNDN